MLERLYTSPRKVFETWTPANNLMRWVFNNAWDTLLLTGAVTGAGYGTYKVFKDGHVRQCMDAVNYQMVMLEMAGGGLCTVVSPSGGGQQLFELDPYTACPVFTPFFTTTGSLGLGRGCLIDRERGIILKVGRWVLSAYSLADPSVLLWTYNIGEDWWNSISWVSDGQVMITHTEYWYGGSTLIFFDYLTQTLVLRTQINPYRVAVFDSRCGVVMAINAAGYTEIYYPQAVPSHLTAPVLDPATVSLYGGSLVTTQVLGDLDEPCPDRVVHWYAEEGICALARTASKSGADGTASNYLFGPGNPAQMGLEETIRVEALI